jgi:RNA polymerase sigma factor (sigma-70 family)
VPEFLRKKDIDILYRTHAQELAVYANTILRNPEDAKESVHDLFCDLYRDVSDKPLKNESIRAFLFVSVRNRAISLLRHKKSDALHDTIADRHDETERSDAQMTLDAVYEYVRNNANNSACEIFFLRIVHEVSWQQIADITGTPLTSAYRLFDNLLSDIRRNFPDVL